MSPVSLSYARITFRAFAGNEPPGSPQNRVDLTIPTFVPLPAMSSDGVTRTDARPGCPSQKLRKVEMLDGRVVARSFAVRYLPQDLTFVQIDRGEASVGRLEEW